MDNVLRSRIIGALESVAGSGDIERFLTRAAMQIKMRVTQQQKLLHKMSDHFQEFLDDANETVATDDLEKHRQSVFKKKCEDFEAEMLFAFRQWDTTDQFLWKEFETLTKQHSHLKVDDVLQALPVRLQKPDINKAIEDHLEAANTYGEEWQKSLAALEKKGYSCSNKILRKVNFLKDLTRDELLQGYYRIIKDHMRD